MRRAVFTTTEDWFFLSHRLPIARALAQRGFHVTVAAADTGRATAITDLGYDFAPLPLVRESLSPLTESKTLAALTALYARLRPTLVHHSTIKANMYGSLAARVTRVPAVVNTITGLGFALTERPNDGVAARLLRLAAQRGYAAALSHPRCVNVFQNSDQQRLFIDRALVDPETCVLIRGAGVDLLKFPFVPEPTGVAPVVLLPARMLYDKGIAEFVAAARLLKARGVVARFVLCGGIDEHNRARIPKRELDAWVREEIVEWWGHQREMPAIYAAATLVVLPSYAEGLPLAVAEAQAVGRAVITTQVPGCREAIVPGVSGLLVPVRDANALAHAIAELLADPGRRETMGLAARRYAETALSEERVINETLGAIARLGVLA